LKGFSTTLETFDGKDIIVPNEQFITLSFVNWTHNNKKQRYSLEFSVAYKPLVPPRWYGRRANAFGALIWRWGPVSGCTICLP